MKSNSSNQLQKKRKGRKRRFLGNFSAALKKDIDNDTTGIKIVRHTVGTGCGVFRISEGITGR
jgi:hypothetical protein